MAFFNVTREIIETVNPIDGADLIQKATLKNLSFTFVIGKDTFKIGDEVLYFPIDSILPLTIQEKLGLVGKLAGKNKDRVKTKKLKSVFSQGVVGPLSLINDMIIEPTPENITKFLGVTKWEPPCILEKGANLKPLPLGLSCYDIEGCDRNLQIVEKYLLDKVTVQLEKLEGMNSSISYDKLNDKIYINQRNYTIELIENASHSFWVTYEKEGFIEKIKQISNEYNANTVTIYGEFLGGGVQGDIYHIKTHTVKVFDIKFDNRYIDYPLFKEITSKYNIQIVPVLSDSITLREWLNGKTIREASYGKSMLYDTLREGIVIKPIIEEYCPQLQGRLIVKQRDPIYLSQTDN